MTAPGSGYVVLRPIAKADWSAVHAWASQERVCRYQEWGPNTPEQTREFVWEAAKAWTSVPRTRLVYAITLDGCVVGTCDLNLRGRVQGEISYALHPECWGRGLATTAARQLVQLGFDEHYLHRVFATCDPRNIASAAVLQRLGMHYEGRMRETTLIRDGWRDSDLYSVLVDEWHGDVSPMGPDDRAQAAKGGQPDLVSLKLGSVVLKISDLSRAAEFWTRALGYVVQDGVPAFLKPATGNGPGIHLDNEDRTHLDLWVGRGSSDIEAEVDRLIALGARRVDWDYPDDADWMVLADTEGNLFCVVA